MATKTKEVVKRQTVGEFLEENAILKYLLV